MEGKIMQRLAETRRTIQSGLRATHALLDSAPMILPQ
jgi:hypothetical protein